MIVRLGQICSNGIVTLVILYFIVVVCRANSIEIEQFDGTIFRQFWYPRSIIPFFFFFFSLKYSYEFLSSKYRDFFFSFLFFLEGKAIIGEELCGPQELKVSGSPDSLISSSHQIITPITLINFFLSFFLFCDETINSSAMKQRFVKRLKREKWMKVEGKLACRSWERLVTLKLA